MIDSEAFTPLPALVGGVLLGGAAALLMATRGRVAGISGIVSGLFGGEADERRWQWCFVAGLWLGGLVLVLVHPTAFAEPRGTGWVRLVVAGVLVGYGTQLGSGCTSGHGVCGVARGAPRSLVATAVFVAVGMLTVAVFGVVGGGR